MAVSKTVDVGSSPTCCAQPTHMLWERSSEPSIVAALVLADPPSLREQSPGSLWRLLILDAWQSGLLHHLAKVATGNGPGVRLPPEALGLADLRTFPAGLFPLWFALLLSTGQPCFSL